MKTFLMTLIAICAIREERDIKLFAGIVGLSLAFYGVKGGIFTIVSGGTNRVLGPESSYIADNNHLALALLVSVPMIWWLFLQARKKWLQMLLAAVAVLTLVSVVGTYSRGALLGGAAMLMFLWLKTRNKLSTGLALACVIPLVLSFMPDAWFDRMNSIDDYKTDASSLGRLNAWGFATNLARQYLFGGGFDVFTPRLFLVYAPDPLDHHAAHSIYFQVLGEHGFIGLALFLGLMLAAWRSGARIIRNCKGISELKWAMDLAAMSQVSIIGFAVGGAFLSLAYYDLYYDIVALLVLLEKTIAVKTSKNVERAKGDLAGSREVELARGAAP